MREYKTRRSRFYWLNPFLLFLSLLCDLAVIWTVYLLIAHKTSLAIAAPIIVVALLVSLWAKSPWRRRKVGVGAAIGVLVITTVIMATVVVITDLQPLTKIKEGVVSWARGMNNRINAEFRLPASPEAAPVSTCEWAKDYPAEAYRTVDLSGSQIMMLKTIQRIAGTESKQIQLKVDCVPCVINYGYEPLGVGENKIFVTVWKGERRDIPIVNRGVDWILINEEGNYSIKVEAVAVDWWLKVGVQ